MKTFKFPLLVFDWDGTLMDSEARIVACIKAAIHDTGMPARDTAAIRDIIGLGLQEAIHRLFPGLENNLHHLLADAYRRHFLADKEAPSALFPGVKAMLEDLYGQGYRLAVATGKGRHGLDHVLEETGCKSLFHSTRCADETFSKPHPKMLIDIMQQLHMSSADTLMIGDTEYDLQMAGNAGCASLAVSHGVHERERLLKCGPLACLDSLDEFPAWLANLGNPINYKECTA